MHFCINNTNAQSVVVNWDKNEFFLPDSNILAKDGWFYLTENPVTGINRENKFTNFKLNQFIGVYKNKMVHRTLLDSMGHFLESYQNYNFNEEWVSTLIVEGKKNENLILNNLAYTSSILGYQKIMWNDSGQCENFSTLQDSMVTNIYFYSNGYINSYQKYSLKVSEYKPYESKNYSRNGVLLKQSWWLPVLPIKRDSLLYGDRLERFIVNFSGRVPHGKCIEYDYSGKLSNIEIYDHGKIKERIIYDKKNMKKCTMIYDEAGDNPKIKYKKIKSVPVQKIQAPKKLVMNYTIE